MSREELAHHSSAGRLLAALWTLRVLARPGETPPEPDELRGKEQPSEYLRGLLPRMAEDLMKAKQRGGGYWDAAADVFRAVPGLAPTGQIPDKTMGPAQQRAFVDAYDEQRTAYREKFGRVLGS